ncbi:MAG: polysaccharide deacetylase family protein [Patescibacteria group bacterium]
MLQIGKIVVFIGIAFILYLIGRSIFGSSPTVESVLPNTNATVNADAGTESSNSNGNTNAGSNTNGETNVNSNVNVDASEAASFDLGSCTGVISSGKAGTKAVSLTFNVGTTKEGEVQKVLDALKNANVEADFFARGDVAEENPDLIKKIGDAGFPIHNLSYSHPYFTDLPTSGMAEQLENAEAAISQRTGKTTKPFFRPPYGDADEDVAAAAHEAGYCTVTWSIDAMDWSTEFTAVQSKERVLSNVKNGSIILMQASNSTTAEIIQDVITELKNGGYAIVKLESLLAP